MIPRIPPGRKQPGSRLSATLSHFNSSFTAILNAWKVRVAGSIEWFLERGTTLRSKSANSFAEMTFDSINPVSAFFDSEYTLQSLTDDTIKGLCVVTMNWVFGNVSVKSPKTVFCQRG